MGSKTAFQPMHSASFALHMESSPTRNQSPLECDWSILLGLKTEKKRTLLDPCLQSLNSYADVI